MNVTSGELSGGRIRMYVPKSDPGSIRRAVEQLGVGSEEIAVVFLADRGAPPLSELVAELSELDVPFGGGLFPGVHHAGKHRDAGAVVSRLPLGAPPFVVPHLSLERALDPLPEPVAGGLGDDTLLLMLFDGLTDGIVSFLGRLFDRVGNTASYLGGGAGPRKLKQSPCLFTREGVFEDAAIVMPLRSRFRLGVRHGWEQLEGSFIATRTRGRAIAELNWEPAFEVYRRFVEPDLGSVLSTASFFEDAKAYPFGMTREGSELIVRDPIAVSSDGEILCVGEVPEHAVLRILKGSPDSLIAAAGEAARAAAPPDGSRVVSSLQMNCISRAAFLGPAIDEELHAAREVIRQDSPEAETWGPLTLGEVSSYGELHTELLNKTIVVANFHD